MPVTNQEVSMKKGAILITRTDLKGVITYVNDEFINISGFTRDELIGAEHNIVRHPDMPAAAFKDLWDDLKALRPWKGVVKNRTKSGDYYWVEANAIPVFKNGKVHEYISVRRAPGPEQIREAEHLYKLIEAKKATIKPKGLAAMAKSINEIEAWKKMVIALIVLLSPVSYWMYQLFLVQDYLLLSGVVSAVSIAAAISFSVVHSFSSMLNKTIHIAYRLAEKKFGHAYDLSRDDLIGDFQRAFYSMEVNLNLDLAQARQDAAKAMQINQALDNVQSGVMVANTNLEIIYTNNSVQRLFKAAEHDIRTQLPNFDADQMLGINIDSFHKDPSHQRRLLNSLTQPYSAKVLIADQHMQVIASPVINNEGERIGFVAEWQNRTPEVRIEQEIGQLVQDVKTGDLSSRIHMGDKQGFAQMLSSGINELADVIESVFSDVNRVMENMAEGDLTVAITSEYQGVYAECKNNINATLAKLSDFIIHIRDTADFIDSSAQEMASGNNNLSSRAEQQAASLEETAASMEQLASTVKNNAQNTVQATEVVNSASQLAQKGGDVVKSAIAAMQEINVSSNKISEIIGVIDEIAFQTNLLALNASVEAARAGEHGRGFSVVATEVRNLAQRSASAAQQSKELIQTSVDKVRAGTSFVNETGAALTEIVESVQKVGGIVAHISGASSEQSAGIDQVNQAVAQMDDITQQNAAMAEQAAAGSIAMSEQSTNMTRLLSFFKVRSEAKSAPAKAIEPAGKKAPAAQRPEPASIKKPDYDDSVWEEF